MAEVRRRAGHAAEQSPGPPPHLVNTHTHTHTVIAMRIPIRIDSICSSSLNLPDDSCSPSPLSCVHEQVQ